MCDLTLLGLKWIRDDTGTGWKREGLSREEAILKFVIELCTFLKNIFENLFDIHVRRPISYGKLQVS